MKGGRLQADFNLSCSRMQFFLQAAPRWASGHSCRHPTNCCGPKVAQRRSRARASHARN